jgi:hypothetical protein
MTQGAIIKVITSAVMTARAVLNVIYLNTLKGE